MSNHSEPRESVVDPACPPIGWSEPGEVALPILNAASRWALVGSPNSGKTTVFNALTGLRNKVANYAGVTVDLCFGRLRGSESIELVDLPGTHSLHPLSPEERVTLDFLTGKIEGEPRPDGILFVIDSTALKRSLSMLGGFLRLGIPTVVILTMTDEMQNRRGALDCRTLSEQLGVPVVPIIGNRGRGIAELRRQLSDSKARVSPVGDQIPEGSVARFDWADSVLEQCYRPPQRGTPLTDSMDRWLLHPLYGILTFAVVMVFFFQAIFSWAAPLQDTLDQAIVALGLIIADVLGESWLAPLLVDGVLAGVGAVIVFIPQIALLFLMITFLEQVGYMSRAVFVIDRAMRFVGLDGRSFAALLSSYACAVPGIMATRGIPDFRQRLTTILVAPLMTCSARLPVYTLIIAAFVPSATVLGFLNLQGLVMLGLYVLGAASALTAAAVLRSGPLSGTSVPFYVELPPYRFPTAKTLWRGVWTPVARFLRRAGTVILGVSIVLWALLSFPAVEVPAEVTASGGAETYQLERSAAAHLGKALEPVFEPIGFDWRVSVGLVASLAAREVLVATLSQIYSVETDDEAGLRQTLQRNLAPPGLKEPTRGERLAVALSILVFFVFALQCVSTLVMIRRETGSWKWPAAAFAGLFVIAYAASFLTYRTALWFA